MSKDDMMIETDVNELLFIYLRQIIYEPETAYIDHDKVPSAAQKLVAGLDILHRFVLEERRFGQDIVSGHITGARLPARDNVLAGPLKAVHSMLQHLIWLMHEVAAGDYRQRLNFANDLSLSFNDMVEYLVKLSLQDRMTGLLNVDGFDERAAELLHKAAEDEQYYVVSVNVNDFRHFNALYGAGNGDSLLIGVADFLQQACTGGELCARIHADNFMCLVKGHDIKLVLRRLNVDKAGVWPRIAARTYMFRYGIYIIRDGLVPVRKMRAYAAFAGMSIRDDASVNYAVFDERLAERYVLENSILENFEKAVAGEEFIIHYQPQVAARSGHIIACEALVRWDSVKHGLVLPGSFIPLFENNGLIAALDFYVFEHVCRDIREAKSVGQQFVPISVNFSRRHLLNAGFVRHLQSIIAEYGIEPYYIEVEITETAFFENIEAMMAVVTDLRDAGFSVAMDDFGSGFSSLNFLKSIPLDVIKIDKLFFNDFTGDGRSRLLLEDILSIARHLGLRTVAEGIETEEQVKFLQDNSCDLIQGFYFYRPMPYGRLLQLLQLQQKAQGIK